MDISNVVKGCHCQAPYCQLQTDPQALHAKLNLTKGPMYRVYIDVINEKGCNKSLFTTDNIRPFLIDTLEANSKIITQEKNLD